MKHYLLAVACAAATLIGVNQANATTFSNISGVVHENLMAASAPAADPGQTLGDFGTNPTKTVLEIVGATSIYGGLVHANTARNQYLDGWTMDFGSGVYNVTFNWQGGSGAGLNPFDGAFSVNGATTAVGESGTLSYQGLTGLVTFVFDPVAGVSGARERASWDLQVADVPLPAGMVLLLGGIVALVLSRRFNTA